MRRVCQVAALLAAACATCLIVFLGMMPRPDVGHLNVLPADWARFIDHQHALRHTVGFFAFHLLLLGLGSLAGRLPSARHRLRLAGAICALAAVLEAAQVFLPRRSVNLEDVLASCAGVALAAGIVEVPRMLFNRGRSPRAKPHAD